MRRLGRNLAGNNCIPKSKLRSLLFQLTFSARASKQAALRVRIPGAGCGKRSSLAGCLVFGTRRLSEGEKRLQKPKRELRQTIAGTSKMSGAVSRFGKKGVGCRFLTCTQIETLWISSLLNQAP